MIIQSKFKDYYDHVAHAYGGGDPKIVYRRDRLQPLRFVPGFHFREFVATSFPASPELVQHVNYLTRLEVEGRLLCVAGKYFRCSGSKNFVVQDPSTQAVAPSRKFRMPRGKVFQYGKLDAELVQLSRAVGAPVFVIERYSYIDSNYDTCGLLIQPDIPKLGEIGLAAYYPAEQLYQDLSYLMGNLMHDCPDLKPPSSVSDKDKIVQHGFDVKQSFRHRQ